MGVALAHTRAPPACNCREAASRPYLSILGSWILSPLFVTRVLRLIPRGWDLTATILYGGLPSTNSLEAKDWEVNL